MGILNRRDFIKSSGGLAAAYVLSSSPKACHAKQANRQWTVYLAQDKHLDYGWCGSPLETESWMVSLLDYYLDLAEQNKVVWNIDSTLWEEVYHRRRGNAGKKRLRNAIRKGQIGYVGNYAVLLWDILDTETAIRACYGAVPIEHSTSVPARTALVMENPAITCGVANILTECGFDFLGRGIFTLRAKSYNHHRQKFPLFWWKAPNGKRILVHWDVYKETRSWGGYAEGFTLASLAGEKWQAVGVRSFEDRNSPEVFRKRKEFIRQTVERYQGYGEDYPVSSILLLGTGWDNWTQTEDFSIFIRRFNEESDGNIRIVDARYSDYFEAVEREIREKNLNIPTLSGSFGISWEEWAAHLAGLTKGFREAQRVLRLAEANQVLSKMKGRSDAGNSKLLRYAVSQVLKFAEHSFGGISRKQAAVSAGVHADAVTQAMYIARSLAPKSSTPASDPAVYNTEKTTFEWRGGRVVFDPDRCAVVHLKDKAGRLWVSDKQTPVFGDLVNTHYHKKNRPDSIFPAALPSSTKLVARSLVSRRTKRGVEIIAEYSQDGFLVESTWLFHSANPWIDVTYHLKDGWSQAPQTLQFCFPVALDNPTYRYDAPGAILKAGAKKAGGDNLPGANPELYVGLNFAAACDKDRTVLILAPDTLLWQFGPDAVCTSTKKAANASAQLTSMPMMNLTQGDRQIGQAGWRDWTFRYRIVLLDESFDAVRAIQESQQFATPPFLQVPAQPPAIAGLAALDIDFPGGPLLAFKVAEDNQRMILRFWNVLDRKVRGSLKLPSGWTQAEICDALERPKKPIDAAGGRIQFNAEPLGILTIAILKRRKI